MQLSSSEICDEPRWWSTYEPDYCLLAESTTIKTPHFQIQVDAGLYVGLHVGGGQLVILNDLEERKARLSITATKDLENDDRNDLIAEVCGTVHVPETGVLICNHSDEQAFRESRFFLKSEIALLWVENRYLYQEPELKVIFEKLILSVQATGN